MYSHIGRGGVGRAAVVAAGVWGPRLLDEQGAGGEVALLQDDCDPAAAWVVTDDLRAVKGRPG